MEMESDSCGGELEEAEEELTEAAMAAAAAAALPKKGLNAPAAAAVKGKRGSMKW